MLAVIFCLVGVAALLAAAEYLGKHKILKGENQRKFVHIGVGTFVAFWPWLISWETIQFIGLAMLLVVLLSRHQHPRFWRFNKISKRESYGDIFFALAIIASALLTDVKIFFALAILNLALADGVAAVIGLNFGKHWRYKIYHHTKTVIGTMVFWLVLIYIMGTGLLFAHDLIGFDGYVLLVVVLPSVLTLLENISVMGLDDLLIPVVVIVALRSAQLG